MTKRIPSISDENHYRTQLTNEDVRRMREAYAQGESAGALASRFGTSPGNTMALCSGRRFRSAGGPITRRMPRKLTHWEAIWLRVSAADLSDLELGEEFGVSADMVKRIRLGLSYAWLNEHLPCIRNLERWGESVDPATHTDGLLGVR